MPAVGGAGACLAVAALLALTGCTAGTSTPAPERSTSAAATSAGLPPGFPASVPLLPGRVVAGAVDGVDLHVWVTSADPEAGYRKARQLLVDGGFVLTKDRVAKGGGDGQACTADLCASFTGSDDARYGPTVQYDVFHGTGIVG